MNLIAFDWLGFAYFVLGVLATLVVGWWFFARTRKRLYYRTLSVEVVAASPKAPASLAPDIEIRYGTRSVPQVVLTRVAVWSAGQIIDRKDVVTPLAIKFSGAGLKARITSITRDGIQPHLAPHGDDQVICGFEFLDQNDGFVVEMLHTGNTAVPTVTATIKGLRGGPSYVGSLSDRAPRPLRSAARESLVPFGAALMFPLAIALLGGAAGEDPFWSTFLWIFGGIGGFITVMFALAIVIDTDWLSGKRIPSALWIPRESGDAVVFVTDDAITPGAQN